jgi:hypothetical protein
VFEIHNSALGKPAGGPARFNISPNGTGTRRLTPWSLHAGDHPDWSPDGQLILFRSVRPDDEFNGGTMYTIRPDGTGLTKLIAPTRTRWSRTPRSHLTGPQSPMPRRVSVSAGHFRDERRRHRLTSANPDGCVG